MAWGMVGEPMLEAISSFGLLQFTIAIQAIARQRSAAEFIRARATSSLQLPQFQVGCP